MSDNKLQQISRDHVYLPMHGQKPPLSQNLGIPESELWISPYTASGAYRDGDVYLICSDGLTDMVEESELSYLLAMKDRKQAAQQMLQRALDNGGRDNISFIILYIDKKQFFAFGKGKE